MSKAQTASVKDVPSSAASHRYPALDIQVVLELLQLDPGDDLLDPVRVVAFDRLGQLCRPHTRAQEVSLGTEGKGEQTRTLKVCHCPSPHTIAIDDLLKDARVGRRPCRVRFGLRDELDVDVGRETRYQAVSQGDKERGLSGSVSGARD